MRRRHNKQKKIIIGSMLCLLALFTVGYSAFQTTLNVNVKGNVKKKTAADILKENVVTTGDGLYKDTVTDGRYLYRGGNPNNYIKLGNDIYRIIALESDSTLKVIKNESLGMQSFDTATRIDYNYCISELGCKVWGSKTTTLNSSGKNVTTMPRVIGGEELLLPTQEASLNIYLNTEWYNKLEPDIQKNIITSIFNIGLVDSEEKDLLNTIKSENDYQWKGKVGLLNVSDYIKTSTNPNCTDMYTYFHTSNCTTNVENYNWLYSGPMNKKSSWTLSAYSNTDTSMVWKVDQFGGLSASSGGSSETLPVLHLSSDITLSGDGSQNSPYQIN